MEFGKTGEQNLFILVSNYLYPLPLYYIITPLYLVFIMTVNCTVSSIYTISTSNFSKSSPTHCMSFYLYSSVQVSCIDFAVVLSLLVSF